MFLDRDGVINRRIPGDYIRNWEAFHFYKKTELAIVQLSKIFGRTLVVTNQQGIGKGLMDEQQLNVIHKKMLKAIDHLGGRIDKVYFCPKLASENPECRKPAPGMAYQAKADYPEINFRKSLMVGDSISDILFGQHLGMKTALITTKTEELEKAIALKPDLQAKSLHDLSIHIQQNHF